MYAFFLVVYKNVSIDIKNLKNLSRYTIQF